MIFWCDCVVMSADYKVLCLYAQSSIFMYLIGCAAACACVCVRVPQIPGVRAGVQRCARQGVSRPL